MIQASNSPRWYKHTCRRCRLPGPSRQTPRSKGRKDASYAGHHKDIMIAGPASWRPPPVITKIPAPMIAPMPRAVRPTGPSTRLSRFSPGLREELSSVFLANNCCHHFMKMISRSEQRSCWLSTINVTGPSLTSSTCIMPQTAVAVGTPGPSRFDERLVQWHGLSGAAAR